jgi:hypothetical protein
VPFLAFGVRYRRPETNCWVPAKEGLTGRFEPVRIALECRRRRGTQTFVVVIPRCPLWSKAVTCDGEPPKVEHQGFGKTT